MKETSPLTAKAADKVFELFKAELSNDLVYHNYNHTYDTVQACRKIAKSYDLSDEDKEVLLTAAWLHDVGYLDQYVNHEDASIKRAAVFLETEGVDKEKIQRISDCIGATKMPQSPKNVLEEILCDADLHNIGTKEYEDKSTLLRTEWENFGVKSFTEQEWMEFEYDFLYEHDFHTLGAKVLYDGQKQKNMARLKKLIRKSSAKMKDEKEKMKLKRQDLKRKINKDIMPDRGIETMFRTASRTHINLSSIADNKANIMLSINALIISVVISGLAPKFDNPDNAILIVPTILLLTVCIITIIFATLSTRPKITKGRFTKQDIESKRSNLLFFGNFFNMTLEDYEWGMNQMMQDKGFLYGTLTRDLYFLGVVLANKYRYLRIAYTIFMYGLIVSVIAFALAFYSLARSHGA